MREFIKALCVFLVLSACENVNDKTVYKPRSSGNINDLSVVIDNELWESPVGETIRSTIGAPLYGLPQDEPQVSTTANSLCPVFTGFVKNSRLVLKVTKGAAAATKFYKDPLCVASADGFGERDDEPRNYGSIRGQLRIKSSRRL